MTPATWLRLGKEFREPCAGRNGGASPSYNRVFTWLLEALPGPVGHAGIISQMPEHIKKKLEEQIRELEHELTHDLPIEIKKAASLGDLSENAEYHMAKQRQVFVNARLGQLKKRMAELSLVNLTNIPKDRIAFGSTVVVFDTTKNEEITYKLVTSEESDVNQGLISTTSPIGRGLVGKQVGDIAAIVTPNGKRELEILKLTTIHDEAP
jgi:transcription elongation factor GreA